MKTSREEYVPLWNTISQFVGISVDPDYLQDGNQSNKSRQLDEYIDDPTAALSVTQAGDYLKGIMWGTGDDILQIEPSREVLDLISSPQKVGKFYDFVTAELLDQMNHAEAGLSTALSCHGYDQMAFGTSGIGSFKNREAKNEGNEIIYKAYGVDTMCIREGKNGLINTCSVTYHWKVGQIVAEFCCDDKGVSEKLLAKMPLAVRNAWKNQDLDTDFTVVFMMLPREKYDITKKGKLGTRYRGVWFFDDNASEPFLEEDFATRPIAVARAIKIRGDEWGRASGTMLISTIRLVNFAVGQSIEVIEKMARPSLGMFGNSIFGDDVLDTSPDGLTVFNPESMAGSTPPVFPIADVGNPSAILEFIVPYLNEKIATAFKIDVLLDFSSAKEMTATESLQRFAIRGKSLSGLLGQQKTELLDPLVNRSINILQNAGRLGVDPAVNQEQAESFAKLRRNERIIPPEVLKVMAQGRPWYKIRYKNELEQLTNTRNIENFLKFMQGSQLAASLYPQIIKGVNWYDLLNNFRIALNIPADMMVSKEEFDKSIAQDEAAAEAALATQLGGEEAKAQNNMASADEKRAKAQSQQQ